MMNNNQLQQQQQPINPRQLTDTVLSRIDHMKEKQSLSLPKNYNASNALNSAMLAIQKVQNNRHQPALKVCTKDSIVKSLLDMTLQGLSPAKKQCYFIVYGNELQMQRSYFGAVAAVKRLSGVKKVNAEVVHQDDEFELGSNEDMELIVKNYVPNIDNQDKPIVAAFAMIKTDEGRRYTVMTIKEIKQSWAQTRQRNNRVQQNFGQEMAKRTVLNRAAKMFINTSDDSDLLTGAINDTTSNEYTDEPRDITSEAQEVQREDDQKKSDDLMRKALGGDYNADSGQEQREATEPEQQQQEQDYSAIDEQLQANEG